MPVLLPRNWVSSSSRLRVNLTATSVAARSSGLLTTDALARFDWKLAIGDTTLTEEELIELAAAKEPLIRVRGRWHALRRSEVEKALLFLERRREGSVVDLVRAVSGIELEDAGLELGDVVARRRAQRAARRRRRAALRAARHAGGDDPAALPVPGARPRLAAAPRRPRDRRDPRRRHGARQDRPGDRDAHLRAGAVRSRRVRPHARRLPDERHPAVGARDRAVRAVAARPRAPRRRAPQRRRARARSPARATS